MPDAWSVDYISSHWRKLEVASQEHSIFQSWDWISCWLEIARKHVYPVLFKDQRKVIGICFVGFGKSKSARIVPFKTIYPFQTGNSFVDQLTTEYNTILCLPEYKDIVHEKFIAFLKTHKKFSKFTRILLNNIPASKLQYYQNSASKQDLQLDIYKDIPTAQINLDELRQNNLPYNHYFSKSFKYNIQRSEKLYIEKYGKIVIERPDNVTQAQNWFQELGKLNKKRFHQKGHASFWDYPENVRMQRAFLNRKFASGAVEIIRVCSGSIPIGYLYNFIYRNTVYFYLSGFRFEDDNRFKPGLLTHNYLIQHHYNSGTEIYDFMAGDQKYKYSMGQKGEDLHHLILDKKNFKLNCINAIQGIKSICTKFSN